MKKIKSNLSIQELEDAINRFCKANVQEIEFNDIKRICDQLGCTYYDKGKNRKSGASECFIHPLLDDNPHYNGVVCAHIKHGGGSNRKVFKRNFVNYTAPGLLYIVRKLKETTSK